jgi:hypothetical protein
LPKIWALKPGSKSSPVAALLARGNSSGQENCAATLTREARTQAGDESDELTKESQQQKIESSRLGQRTAERESHRLRWELRERAGTEVARKMYPAKRTLNQLLRRDLNWYAVQDRITTGDQTQAPENPTKTKSWAKSSTQNKNHE